MSISSISGMQNNFSTFQFDEGSSEVSLSERMLDTFAQAGNSAEQQRNAILDLIPSLSPAGLAATQVALNSYELNMTLANTMFKKVTGGIETLVMKS